MSTIYGNDRKDRLTGLYSRETLHNFLCVLNELQLLLLNISLWKTSAPWVVPTRKINDTLIWLVKSGRFECCAGNEKKELTAGCGTIVPEYMPHSFRFAEGCREGEVIVIHLHIQSMYSEVFHHMLTTSMFQLKHPEAVIPAFLRAIALRNVNQETAFAYAKQLVRELLLEQVETGMIRCSPNEEHDLRIRSGIQYICRNFAHDLSIPGVAEAVNLHEVQFRNLFRKYTGIPPHTYLLRVRLQHAAEKLTTTLLDLEQIARESGFRSISYFCLVFRKYYGVSPVTYRRKYYEL